MPSIPSPAAPRELGDATIKIWRAETASGSGQPGEILAAVPEGITVACGEGALRLVELQKPGGRRLASADFLHGFPLAGRPALLVDSGWIRQGTRYKVDLEDETIFPAFPGTGRYARRSDTGHRRRHGWQNSRGGLPFAQIAADVRPGAQDLAFTSLRDYGRGDFLLGQLLEKPLKDQSIHALLLVALARLERRPADAHTIVDQAVKAAAGMAGGNFKGLVNAVLRNFLRRQIELLAAADADMVARWRHPAWWLRNLRTVYPAQWKDIAAAGNSHPPMCLRINRRRTVSADYCETLAAAGIAAQPLNETALLLEKPLPVERLPGFRAGQVSVQDWGAQRAAALLDVRGWPARAGCLCRARRQGGASAGIG